MALIAVVEDNTSNMKLITDVLVRADYEVLQACDADTGIPLIRERLPDLVIMDMHMPGTDGLSATRLLKADPLTKHIPIIALTARAMEGDREMIMAAGCDEYASKPVRYKDVLRMVERIINEKNYA